MRLIWHIIWKDIRRDQRALLMWALLFVAQVVIGVVARNPDEMGQEYFLKLQLGSMALVVLQMVMGYVLVARLVQADVLIGTTAFWMTRPVSRERLLLAKGLGVLLVFGLLPVLLLLPWWLYCGFGARDLFWSAVDAFGLQLLMIAPAFLVACLTDDLGRVLLWTLLLVIGLVSWLILLQASFSPATGRTVASVEPGVMFTKLWLSAVVLVVGAAVVAAHQYLTRHFIRSVVLLVACLGLVAATGQWCSRDLSGVLAAWSEPAVSPSPGLTDGVSLEVEQAVGWHNLSSSKGRMPAGDAQLQVLLRAQELPDGLGIGAISSTQTWSWPDGVQLSRGGWFGEVQMGRTEFLRRHYGLKQPEVDAETEEWREAQRRKITERQRARGYLGEPRPSLPVEKLGLLMNRTTVPNSFLAKMQAEPPAYQADLQCVVLRREVLAEVPVRDGARVHGGSETFLFRELGKDGEALIATQPTLSMAGLWFSAGIGDRFRTSRLPRGIMVVNRVTGDIAEEWGQWRRGTISMMVAGVSVSWAKYALKAPAVIRAGQEQAKDPQWREHTILALVVSREVARFDRKASTDRFEVSAPPPAP